VGKDQDCKTNECCHDPERPHGAFSHSAYAVDVSVLLP
jgi:hypothetical protein